ncbi:MAG: aminoacetone oxidase family FAD-binding enzyme [Lachnospiraceae bacterium]|nr:aminoacetone oxidase family FAD-binding enzyme [Lachnospiraceae bacterium]
MEKIKVAVIGAGASGMMAAIRAASLGCSVTLYERKARVGQKLLVTGNGKCNLSNAKMEINEFYTSMPERVGKILAQFSVKETISFFESLGVMIRNKGGYLYPYPEQANVVLDALRLRLLELGVLVVCETEIKTLEKKNNQFNVGSDVFDKVIIACGSMAYGKNDEGESGYEMAESLGHQVVKLVPGLCKLKCKEEFLKSLAGVRCWAKLTVLVNGTIKQTEIGELQFTAQAISGIPVFQLSRTAAYALTRGERAIVLVDFFPDMTAAEYEEFCSKRLTLFAERTVAEFLLGMANKKINQVMISLHGLKQNERVSKIGNDKMKGLLDSYRHLKFEVARPDSLANAQVCAGGVELEGLSDDLESLKVPGLFFAGEIIDVDGRCGGYNLQWAWSSGYVAGSGVKNQVKND